MKRNKIIVALLSLAALAGNNALAATATGTMQVNTSVAATCSVNAENISFGLAAVSSNPVTTTSKLTVTCTKGTIAYVGLNAGNSGRYNYRSMKGAKAGNTDEYTYNVFTDSAHSTILGLGQYPAAQIQHFGTGTPYVITLYSKIEGGQYVTPDSYSDTLTVEVVY